MAAPAVAPKVNSPSRMEMGIVRNQPKVQPQPNRSWGLSCFSVRCTGKTVTVNSVVTALAAGGTSVFTGVVGSHASNPWGYYVVSAITGFITVGQIYNAVMVPCNLIPEKEYEENVAEMGQQLGQFDGAIDEMGQSNSKLDKSKAELSKTVSDLTAQLEVCKTSIAEQKQTIDQLAGQLEATNKGKEELLKELGDAKSKLKAVAVDLGGIIKNFVRTNAAFGKATGSLGQKVENLSSISDEIDKNEREMNAGIAEFQKQNDSLEKYLESLQTASRVNEEFMKVLKADTEATLKRVEDYEGQIAGFQKKSQESEGTIQKLESEIRGNVTELQELMKKLQELQDRKNKKKGV